MCDHIFHFFAHHTHDRWCLILRIFDEMERPVSKKILFIFFFMLVALPGIKAISLAPVTIVKHLKHETLSDQSKRSSPAELERTYFHLLTRTPTPIPKTGVLFCHVPAPGFYNSGISLENFQIKKSSLLIKEYLSHIYPSHNFW